MKNSRVSRLVYCSSIHCAPCECVWFYNVTQSRFVSRNCHATDIALTERLGSNDSRMPFIKSSSLINLVYSCKANQTRFECSALFSLSYQRALFFRFLSLPLSEDPSYISIISMNGKQVDVLKRPEANTDLIYFSALSYYKSSVEQISLYLLSHSRIRIIVLTCPNNNVLLQAKSARNRHPKLCVPVKSYKSQ